MWALVGCFQLPNSNGRDCAKTSQHTFYIVHKIMLPGRIVLTKPLQPFFARIRTRKEHLFQKKAVQARCMTNERLKHLILEWLLFGFRTDEGPSEHFRQVIWEKILPVRAPHTVQTRSPSLAGPFALKRRE